MGLINQFGDELTLGDTVLHAATNRVGKIKVFFRPTVQNPKGAVGILPELKKYRLLISALHLSKEQILKPLDLYSP